MEKPFDYKEFLKELEACQERSRKTLLNIDDTLSGVRQTLKDIQETTTKIDKVKEEYNEVMDKLCQRIASSFSSFDNPFKKIQGMQYKDLPQRKTQKQVVQKLIDQEQVLIITGAGISADSGIPTFRGQGGLYSTSFTVNEKTYSPDEFITSKMFKQNPDEIWKWVQQIYSLSAKSKPNQIHSQIDILAKLLSQMGKKVTIATQNIDDLHIKPKNNQYEYYNIHGNCKLVHCQQFHFQPFNPNNKEQKCNICQNSVRPYILFFDQRYGKFYGEEIKDKRFNFVICIGTSLKTGLAINMVRSANQVIQINPEPVIQIGKVYHFKQNTKEVLTRINDQLRKNKIQKIQIEKN